MCNIRAVLLRSVWLVNQLILFGMVFGIYEFFLYRARDFWGHSSVGVLRLRGLYSIKTWRTIKINQILERLKQSIYTPNRF